MDEDFWIKSTALKKVIIIFWCTTSFPMLSQTRVNLKLSDEYKQKQDNHKSIQIVLNNINIL